MKKTVSLIVLCAVILGALVLTGCLESSYSASSIKSGLEKAGYTVSEYTPATFEAAQYGRGLETSKMSGLKTVVYAYKQNSEGKTTEEFVALIFDSISSVDKISNEDRGILSDFARRYEVESALGSANNVFYAGSKAAFTSTGIKTGF